MDPIWDMNARQAILNAYYCNRFLDDCQEER